MSDTDTKASWKAVKEASTLRQTATKLVVVNVGTRDAPVEAKWLIRMLKQTEKDSIEDRAVKVDVSARSDDRVRTDAALLKRLLIEYGVVEGPDGWTKSKSDLDDVCRDVALRDHLAESVDKFTQLDSETRLGFR